VQIIAHCTEKKQKSLRNYTPTRLPFTRRTGSYDTDLDPMSFMYQCETDPHS